MLDDEQKAYPEAQRVVLVNVLVSVGLLAALIGAFVLYASHLALAQAADSFSDIFTATALLVSIRIAAKPADENHPLGHQRAEPIAALVAAVVAGVLAVEVLREAIQALVTDARPRLDLPLLAIFLSKVVAKAGIAVFAKLRHRQRASAALNALFVDARNDVLVGLVAVVGFFAARWSWPLLDAVFAIPVGLYVGWAGFELARENVRLLMGEAPPEARREELLAIVRDVPGVREAHDLRARFHGLEIDVLVHIMVDPALTVRDAHDIGHAVELRLIEEDDVCHAAVHVDADDDVGDAVAAE